MIIKLKLIKMLIYKFLWMDHSQKYVPNLKSQISPRTFKPYLMQKLLYIKQLSIFLKVLFFLKSQYSEATQSNLTTALMIHFPLGPKTKTHPIQVHNKPILNLIKFRLLGRSKKIKSKILYF